MTMTAVIPEAAWAAAKAALNSVSLAKEVRVRRICGKDFGKANRL